MSVPRSGIREPAYTLEEREAIERAIVAWAVTLRARYATCGAGPLECGGACSRIAGHDPPCSCSGDVPDRCEA